MINASQENYLKSILSFEMMDKKSTVKLLSEELNVKPASVTEMLKKLSEKKYIKYEKYKDFSLLPAGREIATKIIRRHRLWETFLLEVLKFNWADVHREAELFEHYTSPEMEQKIDEYLGFPKVDPHGHPIPDADGNWQKIDKQKNIIILSELSENETGTVCQVSDTNASLLNYLEQIGLSISTHLKVIKKLDFDLSIEVEFNGNKQFLSKQMADRIFVLPLANNKDKN